VRGKMNNTTYIKGKAKWLATRVINDHEIPRTEYRGFWETKAEAEKAPAPVTCWDRL